MPTIIPVASVPGLIYQPDFLSADEEAALVVFADSQHHWAPFGRLKRRLSFGYLYAISKRRIVNTAPSMPAVLADLARRLVHEGLMNELAQQIVLQDYCKNSGIGVHADSPVFGPQVCSVSLLSPCMMRFRCAVQNLCFSQVLERRSVLVMSGSARTDWTHEIPGRTVADRRLSITFRTVMQGPIGY
jgi:alkylated DNA repair dioxygenase AlkB